MLRELVKRFWWQRKLPRSVKVMHILILVGISLSVATLLVTLSVADGFKNEFQRTLLQFHAHLTILPEGSTTFSLKDWEKEVTEVKPYLFREALMIHQGVIKGVVLKGTVLDKNQSGLVLGKALAEKLKVAAGDEVKLLIPKGKKITADDTVRQKVSGIFQSGLYEIDDQFVLIDLKHLQKLFGLSATTQGFEIKFEDPSTALVASTKLKEQYPEILVQDWAELNRPLLDAFQLEKWFFWILIGFMVAVSTLNLIGAILLNIFRKKKMIAILRALGMRQRVVRLLFASEGFLLGLIGIGIGGGLGIGVLELLQHLPIIALDPEVYFLAKLPVHLAFFDGLMVIAFSLLLVMGTCIWVSSRVAKIPIREGLHGPG